VKEGEGDEERDGKRDGEDGNRGGGGGGGGGGGEGGEGKDGDETGGDAGDEGGSVEGGGEGEARKEVVWERVGALLEPDSRIGFPWSVRDWGKYLRKSGKAKAKKLAREVREAKMVNAGKEGKEG
jgi:hypothetical protein